MCSITQSMASLIAINYPKVDKHMERRPEIMASTLNLKYNRCYMYNNFSLRKHVHTLCTKAVVVENVCLPYSTNSYCGTSREPRGGGK